MPTKSCSSSPTTSGCVEIAATDEPERQPVGERARPRRGERPERHGDEQEQHEAAEDERPGDERGAARPSARPARPSTCPLKKLIVAHERPKSPCSEPLHVLDVLDDRGPVGAEDVVRVRDLLRRGVLDVDDEAGRVRRAPSGRSTNVITERSQSSTIATPRRRRRSRASAHRLRGSVASRRPSPNWFSANTVRKIAIDGQIVSHGCVVAGLYGFGLRIEPHVCASRLPQLAVGSLMPAPRNVTPTSIMMFVATSSVP